MYANITDIAATLGRPITESTEVAQINAWIGVCELKIRIRLGPLDQLDADVLRTVIAEAVARRARNPEGKQNERIDDYSYGLTSDAAQAQIYITDEEWEMLSPTGSTQGAYLPLVQPQPWTGGCARAQQAGEWA